MVSSTTIWSLCRWIWEEGAGLVRAGGESAPAHLRGSAGIDVTRKISTKRTSGHHLVRSFSVVRVMGARSMTFAAICPKTRRWAAESRGSSAAGVRPAAHRYEWSAGVRARASGRPESVVLEGRRRGGPGGDPTGANPSDVAFARIGISSRKNESDSSTTVVTCV